MITTILKFFNLFKVNPEPIPQNRTHILFIIGVCAYFIVNLSLHGIIHDGRHVPVEMDDAYTYIMKAAQIEQNCFFQDCSALETLKSQFAKEQTDNPNLEWEHYRASTRVFLVYHPLQSMLLLGIKSFGLSWDHAYIALLFASIFYIGFCAAYFLKALWGTNAAGIGLLLLSLSFFSGQGIHMPVPSNLSLATMLLAWGIIFNKRENSYFAVLLCIFSMIGFHLIGKLYALLTIGIYYLHDREVFKFKPQQLLKYSVLVIPAAIAFLLPHIIEAPVLNPDPEPGTDTQYWAGFFNNIKRAIITVLSWDMRIDHFGSILDKISAVLNSFAIMAIAVLGIFALNKPRRAQSLFVSGIVIALLALGLFYVLPRYPGELFGRIWIVLAIILSGSFGCGVLHLWETRKTILLMVSLLIVFGLQSFAFADHFGWLTSNFSHRYDNRYSAEQIDYVRNNCGSIFYTEEASFAYFMSHGLMNCQSHYLASFDPKKTSPDVLNSSDPKFAIFRKPAEKTFILDQTTELHIKRNEKDLPKKIWLKFQGQSNSYEVLLTQNNQTQTLALNNTQEWHAIDLKGSQAQIQNISPDPIYLIGMKTSRDAPYDWPWFDDLYIRFLGYQSSTYRFDLHTRTKHLFSSFEILNDDGNTLLTKIK